MHYNCSDDFVAHFIAYYLPAPYIYLRAAKKMNDKDEDPLRRVEDDEQILEHKCGIMESQ